MRWIETLNGWSSNWADWMLSATLETTALFVVVGAIWLMGRRWLSAHTAYWLFMLVLLKAIVPCELPIPAPLAAWWPQRVIETSLAGRDVSREKDRAGVSQTLTAIEGHRVSKNGVEGLTKASSDVVVARDVADTTNHFDAHPVNHAPPRASRPSWTAVAMACWLAIVALLFAGMARGQFRLRRLLRQSQPDSSSRLSVNWADLTRRARLRRPVNIVYSRLVAVPAVTGLFRPILIIPVGLEDHLTGAQWSWVVLHELAHIRRGDLWMSTAQRVAKILFFFNPVVWLASWLVDEQRECACDDEALAGSSCPGQQCAVAFLMIVSRASRAPSALAPYLAMSRGHADVKRRMLRLLDCHRPVRSSISWRAAVGIGALASVVLPHVKAVGQSDEQELQSHQANAAQADQALDKLDDVELKKYFGEVWHRQQQEIHSAKIRVRFLCLSDSDDKDPLQQNHPLASRNRDEIIAFLNRIDLAGNPDRLRELRDELVAGSLIRDQPAYHVMDLATTGDKARYAWESGDVLTYDGENSIAHDLANHQVTIYKGMWPHFSHTYWPGMLNFRPHFLFSEGLRTVPTSYARGKPAIARESGMFKLEFINKHMNSEWIEEITVDGRGALHRMTSRVDADRVWREVFQSGHRRYPGNVSFPSVHIVTDYRNADKLERIVVSIIEEAQFNLELPPSTFAAVAPANTAVWDKRNGLKLRAAEQPVDDVLSLFEK